MLHKTIISTLMALFISAAAMAETKVSVYSVPFGLVGDVNEKNFLAFNKRLESIPSYSFSLSENDTVLSGDGIAIILDNKRTKSENFNKMLAAIYTYSKGMEDVDSVALRQAISVLSIKKEIE